VEWLHALRRHTHANARTLLSSSLADLCRLKNARYLPAHSERKIIPPSTDMRIEPGSARFEVPKQRPAFPIFLLPTGRDMSVGIRW
jgi:hypothetical protein